MPPAACGNVTVNERRAALELADCGNRTSKGSDLGCSIVRASMFWVSIFRFCTFNPPLLRLRCGTISVSEFVAWQVSFGAVGEEHIRMYTSPRLPNPTPDCKVKKQANTSTRRQQVDPFCMLVASRLSVGADMWVSSVKGFRPLVPSCGQAGGPSDASRRGRRQALVPGPRPRPRRLRLTPVSLPITPS